MRSTPCRRRRLGLGPRLSLPTLLLLALPSALGFDFVPGGVALQDAAGAPFADVQECTSNECLLVLDAVCYSGPDNSFCSRGYNGGIPGPTIRASAGDTVNVHVRNDLLDVDNGVSVTSLTDND